MAKSARTADFDADLIRRLAALLDETGLTEIEIGAGDRRVRVARSVATVIAASTAGASPTAEAPLAAALAEAPADHPGVITSPMVGVVYTSPEPGTPPFVSVGDTVSQGQTLLLIEAMKVFNQIKAPRAGTVTRILISNGTPVEFGEPLMIIE